MKLLRALTLCVLLLSSTAFAQNALRIYPDFSGTFSSQIRPAPAYVDVRVLAANVSETQAIPSGSTWVLFAANCDFYAKTGASAAVPAADTTDGSAPELNPSAWRIRGITQVTVISATTCTITMAIYQ